MRACSASILSQHTTPTLAVSGGGCGGRTIDFQAPHCSSWGLSRHGILQKQLLGKRVVGAPALSRSKLLARRGGIASADCSSDWDVWKRNESISVLFSLQREDEEHEQGAWFPAELSCSYMWYKVLLKHLVPLFVALQPDKLPSSTDSSLVVWSKRNRPETKTRTFCGSCGNDMTVSKLAGYLPVVSTASYAWYPVKPQLLLPAPVPWQLRSWSDIATVRLQLLVALETISSELEWYLSRAKSRMKAPNWWEDMDHSYGFTVVGLIGVGYWIQGFRCFPWLAMNYYMKDGLQLDPVALQCLQNTVNLPYLAKPLYGIISDSVYICGAHRVPYIIIAGILQAVSWGAIVAAPGARKSAGFLTAFLTFSNLGAAVADVANDALVAETGKRGGKDGQLQSFAWLASAAGGLLGNLLAGIAMSGMDFEHMFSLFVLFLVCHVFIAFMVSEQSFAASTGDSEENHTGKIVFSKGTATLRSRTKVKALKNDRKQIVRSGDKSSLAQRANSVGSIDIHKQVSVLFGLVKSPRILLPLLWFMGSYAVIPTLSGSIFYYQSQALGINPFFLGLSKMLGQGGLIASSILYERYLKPVPLRMLVGCVQVLLSICMLSDIGLVYRMNLQVGVPDQLYILGASAFVDAINQFKVLPFMVFFAKLCPAGSEGSLLAFFMSCQCLACMMSGYLGAALASFLEISSTNFANLPVGIMIQALAALLPMVGLMLLPDGEVDPSSETTVEKVFLRLHCTLFSFRYRAPVQNDEMYCSAVFGDLFLAVHCKERKKHVQQLISLRLESGGAQMR